MSIVRFILLAVLALGLCAFGALNLDRRRVIGGICLAAGLVMAVRLGFLSWAIANSG